MLANFNGIDHPILKEGASRILRLRTTNPNVTIDVMAEGSSPDEREAKLQMELAKLVALAPTGGWVEIDPLSLSPKAYRNYVVNDKREFVLEDGTTCPTDKYDPATMPKRTLAQRRFFKCFSLDQVKLPTDEQMAELRAAYIATQQAAYEEVAQNGPAVLENDFYARQRRAVTRAREAAASGKPEQTGLPA